VIAVDVFRPDENAGRTRRGTVRTSLPDPAHDGPHFWGCARIVPPGTIRSLLEFG
jgi:hypothetical protein